jgi:hypothetical protein
MILVCFRYSLLKSQSCHLSTSDEMTLSSPGDPVLRPYLRRIWKVAWNVYLKYF